ncbi:MAG: DUF2283 domain-containing protein [Bacteroidota bacterium]|jgi:uncharacterized protein YuzE|nr:DUF2283 domain-containing protein [Bacteroidota bacterium]
MEHHTSTPEFTIDTDLSIAYLRLSENHIVRQQVIEKDTVIADVDEQGNIVGVEILSLIRFERLMRNLGLTVPDRLDVQTVPAALLGFVWHSKVPA